MPEATIGFIFHREATVDSGVSSSEEESWGGNLRLVQTGGLNAPDRSSSSSSSDDDTPRLMVAILWRDQTNLGDPARRRHDGAQQAGRPRA
mmetsp:Transcript_27041/g.79135  ORF Transcript_27041/g.79135 Transcript_27041/m.79135 type:complete len:91 (-) Transcript_27041:15-287(-)